MFLSTGRVRIVLLKRRKLFSKRCRCFNGNIKPRIQSNKIRKYSEKYSRSISEIRYLYNKYCCHIAHNSKVMFSKLTLLHHYILYFFIARDLRDTLRRSYWWHLEFLLRLHDLYSELERGSAIEFNMFDL